MKKFGLISIILLAGLLLRCYNLNFPSIGYHNMKENETLSIAQEMLDSKDFFQQKLYFENPFQKDSQIRNNLRVPFVAYQIILAWNMLGENLWGARLVNICFGLLSILVMYSIADLLFANFVLSLGAAALLAIMPLAVFFSRNLQAESPAFFFMLLGNLLYLRFAQDLRKSNLLLGSLSFLVSWLYSPNFIFGALPLAFCFPLKEIEKDKKGSLSFFLFLVLPFVLFFIIFLFFSGFGSGGSLFARRPSFQIFSLDYWSRYGSVISWYARGENFTNLFFIFSILGMILAFLKGSGILNRYIIGWVFCLLIYAAFYSEQLHQQNFVQMPFLALVAVSAVYAMWYLSQSLKSAIKKDFLLYILLSTLIIGGYASYDSIKRMHSMVFLGLDVAGGSLKEFTKPLERVFLNTYAQGYGIARYGRRYMGWESNLADFRNKEKEFNIRYVCFYPAEFARSLRVENPTLFNYIQDNYHAKEIGFLDEPSKVFYLILERGKGSDPKTFLDSFSGEKKLRTIYKVSGRYVFFYTIRLPADQAKNQEN